jgi:hypothetical protein
MRLDEVKIPYVLHGRRDASASTVHYHVEEGNVYGELRISDEIYPLKDMSGVYIRLLDHPRAIRSGTSEGTDQQRRLANFYEAMLSWCEVTTARVVTRASASASNASKGYQLQLIQEQGFAVPETLITNEPALVRAFLEEHGRVIFKSLSGNRSIVQLFGDHDLERLNRILWCPTQFQEYIDGLNVRVHVVVDECFATAIYSDEVDYRSVDKYGLNSACFQEVSLPAGLADRCVRLARALDLPVAGIDLKIESSGKAVCLEVNPSPAFMYYESRTGQPISNAVASYLSGSTVMPAVQRLPTAIRLPQFSRSYGS